MVGKYVVNGLSSHDQRSNDVIDPQQFFLRGSDAGTRLFQLGEIICVSLCRGVVSVLFLTGFLLGTAGTHIGRFVEQFTVAGNITITQLCAVSLRAELAAGKTAMSRMLWTNSVFQTGKEVDTIIVRIVVELAGEHSVLMYFSGDGGAGTTELLGNLRKGKIFVEHAFNDAAFRKR